MTNTWKRIWMTPFEQDTKGVRLKSTGSKRDTYPPTYAWKSFIYGERSDNRIVYVELVISDEDSKDMRKVGVDLMNALATLDVIWKDKECTND